MMRTLLESLSGRKTLRARRDSAARRLGVEAVEARCLLATVLWDLAGGGAWSNAANWVVANTSPPVHRVPTATDDVQIPGLAGQAVTVTISSPVSVHSVNVGNAFGDNTLVINGGSLTVGSGEDSSINTLHLAGGTSVNVPADAVMTIGDGSIIAGAINVAARGTFNFGGVGSGIDVDPGASLAGAGQFAVPNTFGSLRINTPLTLPANFEVSGGSSPSLVLNAGVTTGQNFTMASGAVSGPGAITVPNGATLTWQQGTIGNAGGLTIDSRAILDLPGSNAVDLDIGTLTNYGAIDWSGKGAFNGTNGATIANKGEFAISGDSSSGGLTIDNAHAIIKTSPVGTGITGLTDVINNSGVIDVNSGTLSLDATGPNPVQVETGAFNVAAGAVLDFSSAWYGTDTGDVQINAGTKFQGTGLYQFDHGTLSINTNVSVANFTLTGGTVNGPATLNVTGAFNWTGGALDGTGTTAVAGGAKLNIGGPNTVNLTGGHTLNNAGTATWSGASQISGNGGSVLDNSGSFAIINDSSCGGVTFVNSGVLTKASPTGVGTTAFDDYSGSFDNSGTVNVQSGVLMLAGGGAETSATFNIAKGAQLSVPLDNWGNSPTNTLAGTVSFLGAGSVGLDGGTLSAGAAGATIVIGPATTFDWSSGNLGAAVGSTVNVNGTIALIGTSSEVISGGGTVNLAGRFVQTGLGNLVISGTSTTATTLRIAAGSTYALAGDSGIAQGSNDGGIVWNSGLLEKTVGTGTSTVATPLNSTGTVSVSTGTLSINGKVSQVSGTTLEAGTWSVYSTPTVASTLTFAAPASLSGLGVGASVTLGGPHSTFTNLAGLGSNAGSLSLVGGASFTTAGAFTDSGTLTLGAGDTLHVAGKYTRTAAGVLKTTIAGTSASGQFGRIIATGPAALAGTLDVTVPASFTPTVGDTYVLIASSGDSGTFATINGLTLPNSEVLAPNYWAKTFTLKVTKAVTPLALPGLAAPVPVSPAPSVTALVAGPKSQGIAAQPVASAASPPASSAATSASATIRGRSKGHPGHSRPFLAKVRHGHVRPAASTRLDPIRALGGPWTMGHVQGSGPSGHRTR